MPDQTDLYSREPNSALSELEPLLGEWETVGTHPGFPAPVSGHSSFEWLEREALLVWHFDWEKPGPPNAVSVIGHDESAATYSMLYSDERGLTRIYEMSIANGTWRIQRESPGFSQRMTGKFSEDGNRITVRGELSRDGLNWEPDLDIVYTKVR